MRNEEPNGTDPPPGFTGDLAADLGASLGWLGAYPKRRLEDRSRTAPGHGAGRSLPQRFRVSPSSRRASPTSASCSWATKATSSSVASVAGRAERAQARPKGVEYYVSYAGAHGGLLARKGRRVTGACRFGRPGGVPRPSERRAPRWGRLLERVAADTRRAGLHGVGAEVGIARLGTR